MALRRIDRRADGSMLGIWQMTECEKELPCPIGLDLSTLKNATRRLEKLCTHALLRAMTGSDLIIRTLPSGRPVTDGWEISVSHTRGWVAVYLAKNKKVGVDIEYQSDRVNRIAGRFMRADEKQESRIGRLICWCAKETVYKLLSEEDLQYAQMRMKPFVPAGHGVVLVEDLMTGTQISVTYEVKEEFVLTWAEMSK